MTFFVVAFVACAPDQGHRPVQDDGHQADPTDTEVEAPTLSTSPSAVAGSWHGLCDGEVFPAATTTYTGEYEPTVLVCYFGLAEDLPGSLFGGFRYELWYSFSDWEYLLGEGNLALVGTLDGVDVELDVLRDPTTIGRFDLVLSSDALDGELVFPDQSGAEHTDVCAFVRDSAE